MKYMFEGVVFNLFFIGISVAAIVILGFVVYSSKRSSITNKTFFLLALSASLYGWFNYVSSIAHSPNNILWFMRITLFFAVWYSFTLFQLFYVFPKEQLSLPRWYKVLLVPTVSIVSILTLTPFVFSGLQEVAPRGQISITKMGPAIAFFGITAITLVFSALYLLFKRVRGSKGVELKQRRLVLIGCLITFPLYIIFNLILPVFFLIVSFVPFASIFSLPFVVFTAYAIIRHKLLNVKIISTEILVFVLTVAILFDVILSDDIVSLLFRAIVFVLVLTIGIGLIRTVRREVEQREQLMILTKELEAANNKLKELDQAKTDFLSMASHQLRSPLTVVRLGIGALLDETFGQLKDRRQVDALHKMLESTNRLINLIGDYLNVSRIELGKMKYDFKVQDVCALAKDIVEEYQPRAKVKKLKLSYAKIGNVPNVSFDEEKVRHVITNLVDNAIKYTMEGSVAVRCEVEGKEVKVSMKDTGAGLDAEDIAALFQKFRRVVGGAMRRREGEPVEGSGLGLHVAKMFVDKHGGRIWAESKGRGKGSTFFFTLSLSGPPPLDPDEIGEGGKGVELPR